MSKSILVKLVLSLILAIALLGGCDACLGTGSITISFSGNAAAFFDGLSEDQCHLDVLPAGSAEDTSNAVYSATFSTTDGEATLVAEELEAGLYDIYIWFDLDGVDGVSDGDISSEASNIEIVAGSDETEALSLDVVYGTITIPVDTSAWAQVDLWSTLMIYDSVSDDIVDLQDAGLISDSDARSYTYRSVSPGAAGTTVSVALDVTGFTDDADLNIDYYLFAYAEQDGDGEPEAGESYGFYEYGAFPDHSTQGENVVLSTPGPYDFSLDDTI